MVAATTSSSPSMAFSSVSNTLKSPINPLASKVQGFKPRTHHQIRSNGGQAAVGAGKVLSAASIGTFASLDLETSVFKKEKITLAGQTELDPAVKEAFDVACNNIYAFHCAQKASEIHGADINANCAVRQLDPAVKEAFYVAYNDIYAFDHRAQKAHEKKIENVRGVRCKRISRGIDSVGLYLPGGTAVLPSTALMLSVEFLSHFRLLILCLFTFIVIYALE